MAEATARYVIAADDKSKAAIASIQRNFKDLDRNLKGTLKGLNTAFGLFAGGGALALLKRAMDEAVEATAKSEAGQKGFAQALQGVKDAAGDLLIAKGGLPEAT